jgi:hypothetical protein
MVIVELENVLLIAKFPYVKIFRKVLALPVNERRTALEHSQVRL